MNMSTNPLRRPLVFAAAIGVLWSVGACSGSAEPAGPASSSASAPVTESAPSPAATESPSASASPTPSASASSPDANADGNDALLAAGKLAVKEVSGGQVISIEAERDGWEVHVVTSSGGEQQLRTDASGARLVSGPTDDRPDAEDRAENKRFAGVDADYKRAVQAIEREVDGGEIRELSLDEEGRRLTWEADVTVGSQQRAVQIDADSADVISNRVDD